MRWFVAALLLASCESLLDEKTHTCPATGDFMEPYVCPGGVACSPAPYYCGKPDVNAAPCDHKAEHDACTTSGGAAGVCLTVNSLMTCTACTADIAWCGVSGWSAMTAPSGYAFSAVWVASFSDAYIGINPVGTDGVGLLHYDGLHWAPFNVQPPVVAGSSQVTSIWGTSPSNMYVVFGTHLSHYDGTAWQELGPNIPMLSVSGASGHLFVSGPAGGVAYYDGTWHKSTASPGGLFPSYYGVWTGNGTDAYAVGTVNSATGAFAHFDGTAWTATAVSPQLFGTWGATTVYGVGPVTNGQLTILDLTPASASTDPGIGMLPLFDMRGVWGSAADDVFAVGAKGTIYHYNSGWTSQGPIAGLPDLVGVAGSSSSAVFAISANSIWRYTGN